MLRNAVEECYSLVIKLAIQKYMKKRKKWRWNLRCNTVEEDDNEDYIDGAPPPKRRRIQENDPLISSDDDDDTDSSSCGCDD